MGAVLPNFVLVRRLQRLESLVTDITGVNPLSLSCALSPHTDPIQQQHEFPHKPSQDIFRSRCQQMSTSLHVLLKAYPCLEGDVAECCQIVLKSLKVLVFPVLRSKVKK